MVEAALSDVPQFDAIPNSVSGREFTARSTVASVERAIVQHFRVTWTAVASRRRDAKTALARHAAMWLLKKLQPQRSTVSIGRAFRNEDRPWMHHTSVMHGIARIDAMMAGDPAFDAEMRALLLALTPTQAPS